MSDFKWHDKKRLAEQLEFFGAKKKEFISVYSKKKPKIRMENKSIRPIQDNNPRLAYDPRYGMQQAQQTQLAQHMYNAALAQRNSLGSAGYYGGVNNDGLGAALSYFGVQL